MTRKRRWLDGVVDNTAHKELLKLHADERATVNYHLNKPGPGNQEKSLSLSTAVKMVRAAGYTVSKH